MTNITEIGISVALNFLRADRPDVAIEVLETLERGGAGDFELIMRCSRVILDSTYPADIFTGVSGDPGPVLIKALREALDRCEEVMK